MLTLSSLHLAFEHNPEPVISTGEYIFSRVKLIKDGKDVVIRYASFERYEEGDTNGVLFNVDIDGVETCIYARLLYKDKSTNGWSYAAPPSESSPKVCSCFVYCFLPLP